MHATEFFSFLWNDYITMAPQAEKVRQIFQATEGVVINDHVAFRTFADTPMALDKLEPIILALGYTFQDDYDFAAKKLRARSYIHADSTQPKIFLSELLTPLLSDEARAIISKYTNQIPADVEMQPSLFWSGRHWAMPTLQEYRELLEESEYAGWLLAMGIRANHFTASINHMTSTQCIREVLDRVKAGGYAVNTVGGEVKGTPDVLLEQGSTLADQLSFVFGCGAQQEIPTCFYEFAKRYADARGEIYQGFIAANADKIFESTNAT